MIDNKYQDGVYYNMPEVEYRAINRDSYSTLKDYKINRNTYYEKHILKQEKEKKPLSTGMIIGSMLDVKMSSVEEFNDLFEIEAFKKPTGQYGDLINEIINQINQNKDIETNILTKSFSDILQISYKNTAFDSKNKRISLRKGKKELTFQEVYEELEKNEGLDYIKQYIESKNKILYNSYQEKTTEELYTLLCTHNNTKKFFGFIDENLYNIYNQLVVLFTYNGRQIKSKIDKIIIDKQNKNIIVLDLKVTYDNEQFLYNFYKLNYNIQAALYTKAIEFLLQNDWKDKYKGYKISAGNDFNNCPFIFVTGDYKTFKDPLIYGINENTIKNTIEGHINIYGNYVPGVDYIINNLQWHEKTNIWSTNMYNYNNNGFIEITEVQNNNINE